MNTVSIDIGGTFTDCFINMDEKEFSVKVPTTKHDLSVGLLKALGEAATKKNLDLNSFLQQVNLFEYSTTVAINKLIARKGPKLGLIVTEGFEDIIFVGKGTQWADGLTRKEKRNLARIQKPIPLIPKKLTVGVRERVDADGNVLCPLDEEDAIDKVRFLINQGVRGIVVCFLWSFMNPIHEQRIKDIIETEFPDYYLGNIPYFLSSDVHPKRWEYTRTMVTILNGYLHQSMSEEIANIRDELRSHGYSGPLLMVHNSGGMAESFRTSAISTFNGGPVAGLIGGAHIAREYGINNAVVTDMGGTSFDVGIIVEGGARSYQSDPIIDRWLVDLPILESKSIGAGGGSIASINVTLQNRVEVGPQSAGSMPGPACYNQGGEQPTVTDADVVLGYINPAFFHGGKHKLSLSKAWQTIEKNIATPLGIEVLEAALLIKKVVDGNMGNEIFKETALKGFDPREFVLLVAGGAGSVHCCGYAEIVGINKIITFPYSSVFCAFSASCMDIMHIYEQSKHMLLISPLTKDYALDYVEFNKLVMDLKEKAIRDIRGEGFGKEQDIIFQLELDMKYGAQINLLRITSPRLAVEARWDLEDIYQAFVEEFVRNYSALAVDRDAGVEIENFLLKAVVLRPKTPIQRYAHVTNDPALALKGKREVFWENAGLISTDIYDYHKMDVGNAVNGPVVIEAVDTSYVIPPGWRFRIDELRNGLIEKHET